MHWYYILLIILGALIILACLAFFFCRDYEYSSSSEGHSDRNEYATTTTAIPRETEHFQSNSQTLAPSMPLPPSALRNGNQFSNSEPYPPKPPPIGFGYSAEVVRSQPGDVSPYSTNAAPYPLEQEIHDNRYRNYYSPNPEINQYRNSYRQNQDINDNQHRNFYPPNRTVTENQNRTYSWNQETGINEYPPIERNYSHSQAARPLRTPYPLDPYTTPQIPYNSYYQRNVTPNAPYSPDPYDNKTSHSSYHQTNAAPIAFYTISGKTSYPSESNTFNTTYFPENTPYTSRTPPLSARNSPKSSSRNSPFSQNRRTYSMGELPPSYWEDIKRDSPRSRYHRLRRYLSASSLYDNM